MINHNLLMYSLFDRSFSMDLDGVDYVVNYTEGDLYELAAKLVDHQTMHLKKYPIIWLQTGYTVQRDKTKRSVKLEGCRIFFITSSQLNPRYKQRFETNYNDFLYRILLKFDDIIDRMPGINSEMIDEFRTFPLNDISELTKRERDTDRGKIAISDIWDAIEYTTDIEISNECFPEFKIKI